MDLKDIEKIDKFLETLLHEHSTYQQIQQENEMLKKENKVLSDQIVELIDQQNKMFEYERVCKK